MSDIDPTGYNELDLDAQLEKGPLRLCCSKIQFLMVAVRDDAGVSSLMRCGVKVLLQDRHDPVIMPFATDKCGFPLDALTHEAASLVTSNCTGIV